MKKEKSRHPKLQYWSLQEEDIVSGSYRNLLDRVEENGCFDTLCISGHAMNLWDTSYKPLIREVVEYAVARGFRVPLQVFPKGMKYHAEVGVDDAAALVTEYECPVQGEQTVIRAVGKNVRFTHLTTSITSELLRVYAFRKCGDGFYGADSLVDITGRAKILYRDPECLSFSLDTGEFTGYTVYAMVAHYYSCIDLFSQCSVREYRKLMDAYGDLPLSGIVLDEFKNMVITPPWAAGEFRERFYGKNFHRYFKEQTGEDLIQTLFEMRFCPLGRENVRICAINRYFDVFRHSTKRMEQLIAEYSQKVFGENAFWGLHNTYHNDLQSDEIWQTCCNWWEVPRKYAQTDEDIPYPIRMGIACGCQENLVYDMYYATDKTKYFEKAIRDARFGGRIHYHIMRSGGNSEISWNTGNSEFLEEVKPYEEKIELLNLFDPAMPKMELLVVFGFPALCNWYPNTAARSSMDINGELNITDRVNTLWEKGYLNALAPSDAIADGRITMKNGEFDYCGHRFRKLLFLYPQYSKPKVLRFLQNAICNGYDLKILGELTWDFDGKQVELQANPATFLAQEADIPAEMHLTPNSIPDGCVLADQSVVITNYDSIARERYCSYRFHVGEYCCEATFKGVLAVKLDESGKLERLAAGNLKTFAIDGTEVLSLDGEEDCLYGIP